MRVKIEVTQEDINRGKQMSCISCPVARAARRRLTGDLCALRTELVVGDGIRVPLPFTAQAFITGFDYPTMTQRYVKPFSFTINVPARLVRK